MARGRKPVPTKLKILRGNPGKRPLNSAEPQPTPGVPTRPEWLSTEAKREWNRVVPELDKLGLVAIVDLAALAAYCQAFAELEWATRVLEAEGRLIEVPAFEGKTKKAHPAVALQRDAFTRVKAFLVEFGLTPSARSRMIAPNPKQEADPLEAYLGGTVSG